MVIGEPNAPPPLDTVPSIVSVVAADHAPGSCADDLRVSKFSESPNPATSTRT